MSDLKKHLVLIAGINNSAILWDQFAVHSPPWLVLHRRECPPLADVNDIAAALLVDLPDKFYLCGFSFGGYVSMAILAAAKHRIEGLILANTQDGTDTAEQVEFRQKSIHVASQGNYEALALAQTDKVFHGNSAAIQHLQATRERMISDYGEERFIAHQKACTTRPDSKKLLNAVSMPVLVVVGEDDRVIPKRVQEDMARNIPNCAYKSISGAGHMMPLEKAEAFSRLVVDWIEVQS